MLNLINVTFFDTVWQPFILLQDLKTLESSYTYGNDDTITLLCDSKPATKNISKKKGKVALAARPQDTVPTTVLYLKEADQDGHTQPAASKRTRGRKVKQHFGYRKRRPKLRNTHWKSQEVNGTIMQTMTQNDSTLMEGETVPPLPATSSFVIPPPYGAADIKYEIEVDIESGEPVCKTRMLTQDGDVLVISSHVKLEVDLE